MDYWKCHSSLHYRSDCLCRPALHSIQSSLGSDSACPLHQPGRRDNRLQLIQYRYRCNNLDLANAAHLASTCYVETEAAIDLALPPGWLVRLIDTSSMSMSCLTQSYRVCIFSLIRITKLPEISLVDPGCELLEYYQSLHLLIAPRDFSV